MSAVLSASSCLASGSGAGSGHEYSFFNFLVRNKEAYLDDVRNGKGYEWVVVMGNEAGGKYTHQFTLLSIPNAG